MDVGLWGFIENGMSHCIIVPIGESENFYPEKIFDVLAVGTYHSFPGKVEVGGGKIGMEDWGGGVHGKKK